MWATLHSAPLPQQIRRRHLLLRKQGHSLINKVSQARPLPSSSQARPQDHGYGRQARWNGLRRQLMVAPATKAFERRCPPYVARAVPPPAQPHAPRCRRGSLRPLGNGARPGAPQEGQEKARHQGVPRDEVLKSFASHRAGVTSLATVQRSGDGDVGVVVHVFSLLFPLAPL